MLNKIKDFFDTRKARPGGGDGRHTASEFQIAAAALLVHVAAVDSDYSADERAKLVDFAVRRFELGAEDADALIRAAEGAAVDAVQIHGFTNAIKNGFDYDERVDLVETLWSVVYCDGRIDDFEAQVMRRICGLIYVEDRDSALARQRALDKSAK